MAYYETGKVQRYKTILFLNNYHKKYGTYPRRKDIAGHLGLSTPHTITMVRKMIEEGLILTQPKWQKGQKQWTVIVGLKKGTVPSAKKALSRRRVKTS